MDAQQALADLTEISSQIQAAVVFDDKGKVAASTLDPDRAGGLADGAARLLEQAEQIGVGDGGQLIQLEAATQEGSVFVVADGPTRIAATTPPEPTVGLVFYDLKSALRSIATKPAAKRRVRASGPGEGVPGEPAAKRPVRASGPGEGVPGEPEGSPAPTKVPKKRAAAKKAPAAKRPGPQRKKPDAP